MESTELDDLVKRVTASSSWKELVRLIASGVYTPRLIRNRPDDERLGAELERAGLCVYLRRERPRRRLESIQDEQPPSSR